MKSISNLTQKQQAEFKSIVKLLDNRDYKKGLKQITKLSSQVESGEILSLKSIFLFYNDQKQEGTALAKQALFKNLKSDFCWHIYGLINKAQKNYAEAIKCFQQTLKNDQENESLIKDLANLQLHVRDYEGHAETRRKILFTKSSVIINWVAFAIGNHLNSEAAQAYEAIKSTSNLIANDQKNKLKSLEQNEFVLYQASLLLELERYDEASNFIHQQRSKITDRLSLNELLFKVYQRSGNMIKAQEYAKFLIELQPQNWNYYNYFIQVAGGDESRPEQLAQLLKDNFNIEDNSLLKGRILGYISVEGFKEQFMAFISPYFSKALPSLFREIVHVYKNPVKITIMEECYKAFLEDQTKQLWAMMLLAQHFNYGKQYDLASEWIEKAIEHTPTLHELYLIKAKILKGLKQFTKAAEVTDMVRKLDLADRYLNNKAVRYALRANQVYAGQDLILLFLRDTSENNPHDLQSIWYELAMGEAYLRMGYYGPAFRMFKLIEKHFEEMYEDQTEFYQYSMRRYSIGILFDMIKSSDEVHNNKYFIKSAGLMIQGLIQYSIAQQQKKLASEDTNKIKLSPAEKKKLQKLKQKDDEDADLKKDFTIAGHIFSPAVRLKLDLEGEQFLSTLQETQEINQFARLLINTTNTKDKKICFNAFKHLVDHYIQQDRPTLAMKLLNKLVRYTDENNKIISHKYKLKLLVYLSSRIKDKNLDVFVQEAIEEGLIVVLGTLNPTDYNKQFFNDLKHKSLMIEIASHESSLILAGDVSNQNKFIVDLIVSSSESIHQVYDVIEEHPQLLHELKNFLEQRHLDLHNHYFVDPNILWQAEQIQAKKSKVQKLENKQ